MICETEIRTGCAKTEAATSKSTAAGVPRSPPSLSRRCTDMLYEPTPMPGNSTVVSGVTKRLMTAPPSRTVKVYCKSPWRFPAGRGASASSTAKVTLGIVSPKEKWRPAAPLSAPLLGVGVLRFKTSIEIIQRDEHLVEASIFHAMQHHHPAPVLVPLRPEEVFLVLVARADDHPSDG